MQIGALQQESAVQQKSCSANKGPILKRSVEAERAMEA